MSDVMLDIETLGLSPGSVILSIGAIRLETNEKFYEIIDIQSCLDKGLIIEAPTLEWWLSQSDKARQEILSNDRKLLEDVLNMFNNWITKEDRLWGNGAAFDIILLKEAYRRCGIKPNWKYRNEMCYRTLAKLFPNDKSTRIENDHIAINDAINQAAHLKIILTNLTS